MKRTILAFTLFLFALSTFAQTHADVDAAVAKFKNYYNHRQSDSIFNMLSDRAKKMMPLDKTRQTFGQLTTQLGEMQSYEFTKEEQGHSFYKTIFDNATLALAVSLDKENKLETFRFLPYKEGITPAPHEKSNIILKTRTGNIYGTLTMPEGAEKFPVVLMIAGSGPTDRNGNSNAGGLKTDTYKMLADSLKQYGIASVRYDKRGVGESMNAVESEDSIRFEDMIDDAVGFIKMLKTDSRFSKVIVAGHSEGSLIGMIAARKEKVAAYISISGIAERADKVIEEQLRNLQSAALAAEAQIIFDSLAQGYLVKNVDSSLMSLFRPSVQPYMISWLKYEPVQEIKKLKIPVLIIQGTTDIQVDVDEAEKLKKSCPKATLEIITGMNHVLKDALKGPEENRATYTNPTLPLSPKLMPAIVTFIRSTP